MILRPSSPFDTEYTYDLPSSPSTTQHYYSSAMPRSISPLHFSSSSSHGKQASRAADISRLLDPSYSSHSTSKAGAIPTAYVDIHGDLHDPDYRHFPISPSRNQHTSLHSHNARRHGRTSPRLHWELQLSDEHALDDEYEEMLLDEEEEGSFFLSSAAHPQNHHRYSASTSRLSSRARRDGSFSTTSYSIHSPTYYSPTTTTSTVPTSYESDKTILSQLGGDNSFDEKKTGGAKKRRRLSRGDKEKEKLEKERERSSMEYISRDLPATTEEEDHHNVDANLDEDNTGDERQVILGRDREEVEYVPTCGQSLRRQWQAFSLRFRFGVFRAQRRMMRRVHSFL